MKIMIIYEGVIYKGKYVSRFSFVSFMFLCCGSTKSKFIVWLVLIEHAVLIKLTSHRLLGIKICEGLVTEVCEILCLSMWPENYGGTFTLFWRVFFSQNSGK